jgi:hypothetical protein
MKDETITVRIPTAVKDGLQKIADYDGKTISKVVQEVLRRHVEKQLKRTP